jgi:hypothetical protein
MSSGKLEWLSEPSLLKVQENYSQQNDHQEGIKFIQNPHKFAIKKTPEAAERHPTGNEKHRAKELEVTLAIEHLLTKHEAQSSTSSTAPKKTKAQPCPPQ